MKRINLAFLAYMLGMMSVAFATPATTQPNVSNLLTQCAANVPVVGNGSGASPVCWPTGAVTAIAHVTSGTGVNTALGIALNASGGIVSPTPTRAGDIVYWNGSAWVTLAGNNSGTQFLQESASGVPSWATVSGAGTVTSVTCGAGLSGGTFTSSGTCAVALSILNNSLVSTVPMTTKNVYYDGPTVAQGTTGTWFASGNAFINAVAINDFVVCKLWDGTTVIDSGGTNAGASIVVSLHLSGYLASPAGNLRISCSNIANNGGTIGATNGIDAKASTISALRIQ